MKTWVNKKALGTQHIKLLVFDEADEMLKVIVTMLDQQVQLSALPDVPFAYKHSQNFKTEKIGLDPLLLFTNALCMPAWNGREP